MTAEMNESEQLQTSGLLSTETETEEREDKLDLSN